MIKGIQSITLGLSLALLLPAVADEKAAIEKLKLPGIEFNVDKRYIDVDSIVCLDAGALELIACVKGTKEHESVVMVEAKPVHIHTALLLIGARAGNPAMRKQIGEGDDKRWMHLPPRGGAVKVSLVIPGEDGKEEVRPIADFIQHIENDPVFPDEPANKDGDRSFPTSTFLFTGSHLIPRENGPQLYLADDSGNVISISTFGDEVLGLPDVLGHDNGALVWEINPKHLPATGAKVKLRLQPQ